MKTLLDPYRCHYFPAVLNNRTVWLYHVFSLKSPDRSSSRHASVRISRISQVLTHPFCMMSNTSLVALAKRKWRMDAETP